LNHSSGSRGEVQAGSRSVTGHDVGPRGQPDCRIGGQSLVEGLADQAAGTSVVAASRAKW